MATMKINPPTIRKLNKARVSYFENHPNATTASNDTVINWALSKAGFN
jgi:hypothetical protein